MTCEEFITLNSDGVTPFERTRALRVALANHYATCTECHEWFVERHEKIMASLGPVSPEISMLADVTAEQVFLEDSSDPEVEWKPSATP